MRRVQMNLPALCGICLCGFLLAGSAIPGGARQDAGASIPRISHAIRNSRDARFLLSGKYIGTTQAQAAAAALPAVNAALGDLYKAAKTDEKSLADVPPNNNSLPSEEDRIHKVVDLLKSAHRDAGGPESDPPGAAQLGSRAAAYG